MNKPRGFIKPRYSYEVRITGGGTNLRYHIGFTQRAAVHAYKRAQKGGKGSPAPCTGKMLVLLRDGCILRGLDANGMHFRI